MRRKGAAGGRRHGGDQRVPSPRPPRLALPELSPYGGEPLRSGGEYDGIEFRRADLTAEHAHDARFIDCAFRGCSVDEVVWRGSRLVNSELREVRGVGSDLSSMAVRDVTVHDARLGGVQAHGAVWERVVLRGGKIDYLNLRAATLTDVLFDGCVLVEPDFSGARLERVAFTASTLRRVDFTSAVLTDVDLRSVSEWQLAAGLERLSGAVITPAQLLDLAPAFAAQLGIRVAPEGDE